MTGIEEIEFLLPGDVVICPIEKLAAEVRRQIASTGNDYAISRPHLRIPSKVINGATASLLRQFTTPATIVDAVARYSKASSVNPLETLEASFDALQSLIAGHILVPGSDVVGIEPQTPFVPGMEIAGCRILRVVQALEDCAVYEALSTDHSTVAIKVVPAAAPELAHKTLLHEAHALRLLNGVCAPALLAQGECDGNRHLILEWIPGRDIASEAARLRLCGDTQRPALHDLCVRTVGCFAALHSAGVVHGDVHPGNILVSPAGAVRILDFGRCASARICGEPVPRAGVGHYLEPELAAAIAQRQVPPPPTPSGEQYAVAALLYHLLTGRAYTDFSLEREPMLRQIMEAEPIPFARAAVTPWPAAEEVLLRALQKDPLRRFASMEEFARRLALAQPGLSTPHRIARQLDSTEDHCASATPEAAWFLLRAAIVREDARLLARADVVAEQAAASSKAAPLLHYVRARIAHARNDSYVRAQNDFCRRLAAEPTVGAVAAACWFIAQGVAKPELRAIAEAYFESFTPHDSGSEASVAWLRVVRCLGIAPSPQVIATLHTLAEEEKRPRMAARPTNKLQRVSFWTLANELAPADSFRRAGEHVALACLDTPTAPPDPQDTFSSRAFALLRWYRHTGDAKWLGRARTLARRCPGADLLQLELEKPEQSELPFYLSP